ncbi:hypothetical protein TW65_03796 [Stemphylium lycopersici]|nr:hypothetical protein TW65_03796 [Stemphylium lycopersici]
MAVSRKDIGQEAIVEPNNQRCVLDHARAGRMIAATLYVAALEDLRFECHSHDEDGFATLSGSNHSVMVKM